MRNLAYLLITRVLAVPDAPAPLSSLVASVRNLREGEKETVRALGQPGGLRVKEKEKEEKAG